MDLQLKQTYTFEVYPNALLGNGFKNVTVLAIMDQETANQQIDTQAMHVQVKPTLPVGSPSRPSDYNYVKLRLANGTTTIIGIPWIKQDTIVQVTSSVIRAVIAGVTPADVPRVRNCLVQNGFNNIEITLDAA